MIFVIVAIVAAVLIALDAIRNLREGVAKTTFGTYSRQDRPAAFRALWAVKLLMSAVLLVLASVLAGNAT